MQIAIVVLHYKNRNYTLKCLRSVAKIRKNNHVIRVIAVDNDEKPLNLSLKEVNIPVNVVVTGRNLGFAGGVNAGIKKALAKRNCRYVLILNNDTTVPKDLLPALTKKPRDIASPVVEFTATSGNKVYDYGGCVNWWTGRTKHIEHKTYNPSNTLRTGIKHFENRSIDYVSGCCMLISRDVFEKIGLFDENFFFYFEDVDFCTRAKKAGFRVENEPSVKIQHKLGASIGRWTSQAIFRNVVGNFLFVTKHFSWHIPIAYGYLALLSVKIVYNKLLER